MKTKISKKMYVLPLLLVVFLSGCVTGGGGSGATGEGLVLKIEQDPQGLISEGASSNLLPSFILTVENKAKSSLSNIQYALVSSNEEILQVSKPSLPTSLPGATDTTISGGTPVRATITKAKSASKTSTSPVDVTFKALYRYEAEVTKTIKLESAATLREAADSGSSTPTPVDSDTINDGPVSMRIISIDTAKARPGGVLVANLALQNSGPIGGTVIDSLTSGSPNAFLVRIDEFTILGNTLRSCRVTQQGSNVIVKRDQPTIVTLTCDLPTQIQYSETPIIKAKVSYPYRVEKTISVQVAGSAVEQ